MLKRSIDIAVFGATGFSGRLVTTHLATLYGDRFRIAAAGRDGNKLERLREALGRDRISTIVADANDPASLKQLAATARVVISTVGPYHSQGTALVEACAEAGTDYCDLSAEPDWILRMIHEQEGRAIESGARLLFSCGFDSVPSEIGVMALQREALDGFHVPLRQIGYRISAEAPPLSGGTIASLRGNLERAAHNAQVAALLADPFSLTPQFRGSVFASEPVSFDAVIGEWTAPLSLIHI